jgi:hypothetical protein
MNEDANGVPVADLTMPPEDSLNGVPNVGPARRAALEAAGVTTRAQLARATVDQLVGMTGMARSLAERTLEFVRQNAVVAAATNVGETAEPALGGDGGDDELPSNDDVAATDGQTPPALLFEGDPDEVVGDDTGAGDVALPTDEGAPITLAEAVGPTDHPASVTEAAADLPVPDELPPTLTAEDGDLDTDAQTDLERNVLRAQTALSDLTRLLGDKAGKEFTREAERTATLLDRLPGRPGALKRKQVRRLNAETEALAAQLELLVQGEAKRGKKAQKNYAAVLRDDRKFIEAKFGLDKNKQRSNKKK